MRVIYTRNRFEVATGGKAEQALLLKAGWVLDKRIWTCYTRSAEVLTRLLAALPPGELMFDENVARLILQHRLNITFSHASEISGVEIPCPEGKEYLPFQKPGVVYLKQHAKCLLADDPGLGKTIQFIGLINSLPEIKTVLIVCPAMIKINWGIELEAWLTREYSIGIGDSTYLPETDIQIINYDVLMKLRPTIDQRNYDLLGVDEAHMVKDEDAKRTQAVFGKYERGRKKMPGIEAPRKVFITGTPLVNRPEDIWTFCRECDPMNLGKTWTDFAERYCAAWDAPWGYDTSGASNLDELKNSLRGSFMIRRTKAQVLKDLPPKRRQIVIIPNEQEQIVLREREFFARNVIKINAAIDKAEREQVGDSDSYKKAAKGLINVDLGEDEELFVNLSTLRLKTALAKIPYATTYIKLMLEERSKMVIYGHHLELLNTLYSSFESISVLITGDTENTDRQRAIEAFQNNPKVKLCFCGVTLALGITLTAASYGLFIELDWRAGVVSQAEDRMHRIGQKECVVIQHLVFQNSVDALVAKTIIKKQEIAEKGTG